MFRDSRHLGDFFIVQSDKETQFYQPRRLRRNKTPKGPVTWGASAMSFKSAMTSAITSLQPRFPQVSLFGFPGTFRTRSDLRNSFEFANGLKDADDQGNAMDNNSETDINRE